METRRDAVAQAMDDIRNIEAELGVTRAGVEAIFSAGHGKLADIGDDVGVVYKPSGAGAGDCGIALADDVELLDRFDEAASDRGFVTLDIRRDNNGV